MPGIPLTDDFAEPCGFCHIEGIMRKASRKNVLLAFLAILLFVFVWFFLSQRSNLGQYRVQDSYHKYDDDSDRYSIRIVADLDKASSLGGNEFRSIIKEGTLSRRYRSSKSDIYYTIEWTGQFDVKSTFNEKGRGLELSELVHFKGDLLACDDRTGISTRAFPRYILSQGDGDDDKGLKCEWMTVKGDKLLVGSIGKEWTNEKGVPLHNQLFWVKEIDSEGHINAINWTENYEKVREAAGTTYPGYLVHEAVNWDAENSKWVFLPRRVSTEEYTVETEEMKGSNLIIIASEDFSKITLKRIGPIHLERGFSSFKFIPFRHNEIVALRSVENAGAIETYMTVFDLDEETVLMEDTKVADNKFEGVEIV